MKELTEAAGDVYCITGPLWLPNAADGEDPAKWRLQHDLIGGAGESQPWVMPALQSCSTTSVAGSGTRQAGRPLSL